MSKIAETFAKLKNEGRKAFIPFVSAGDPDLETSKQIVLELAKNGADVIELGIPFSDPMADGPTIQASSMRALANGVDLSQVIRMVKDIREESKVPVILFSYLNPLLAYGFEKLADDARQAEIDGVLITDAIDEEAQKFGEILQHQNIDLISLIAPTSTDERLQKIAEHASGFIYAVARAGVTGTRDAMSADARLLVERMREFTTLPIAVGFGISTAEHIQDVWSYADGAVVGSAIVKVIENSISSDDAVKNVSGLVRSLLSPVANTSADI